MVKKTPKKKRTSTPSQKDTQSSKRKSKEFDEDEPEKTKSPKEETKPKTTKQKEKLQKKKKAKTKKETPKKTNNKKHKKEESDESSEEEQPQKIQTVISKGNAVVDIHFPNASSYHVVADTKMAFNGKHFSATLNKSDLIHNNNKFYIIQLLQNDGAQKDIKFYTRWGRVGVVGQSNIQHCNFEMGIRLFRQKYSEKTRGGYEEIIIDYSEDKKEEKSSKKSSTQKPKKSKSLLSKPLEDFIRLIYNTNIMNTQMKEIGYDSNKLPLGKLAKETLKEGYNILKQIEQELSSKSPNNNNLLLYSSQFYSKIPHNFGYQKMVNFIINTKEKLKAKVELIDSLSDITIATKIIDEGEKVNADENKLLYSYYQKLHCKIRPMDSNEKIYSILEKYLQVKSKSYAYKKLTLLEAFEIEREGEKERFDTKIGNRMLLWHGTRITNYVGILSQGLRIAPPEAPSSGYLFGKGLYFADMAAKSSCYCYPMNNIGLIILAEVALGKMDERKETDSSLPSTLKKGCNSAHGIGRCKPGGGEYIEKDLFVPNGQEEIEINANYLSYNEFIVYNVNQVKLKYVLKIRFN